MSEISSIYTIVSEPRMTESKWTYKEAALLASNQN